MKLFVIGATGRTGQEIVQQALARGHQVTAFVRSPENITVKSERLTILKGARRADCRYRWQSASTFRVKHRRAIGRS